MIRIKIFLVLLLLLINSILVAQPELQDTLRGGILYSRIGYNLDADKHILIRGLSKEYLGKDFSFAINDGNNKEVFNGELKYWGEKWKSNWWVVDFSALQTEGMFSCQIKNDNKIYLQTEPFRVKQNLLWDDTWKIVSLNQLDGRIELRNKNSKKYGPQYSQGGGWQDCGSHLREVNSHATMLIGLMDLLEFASGRIQVTEREEVINQIIVGLDYVAFCQDKARELGKGEGAIIHEWPDHTNVITGDVAKGALCFARAGYLLSGFDKDKSTQYLQRAEHSFKWLDRNGPINNPGGTSFSGKVQPDDGFNPLAYGAPEGFVRPNEYKTRDILMLMWAAVELSKTEKKGYKERAIFYARILLKRQIPIENPEGHYYGHFKSFASAKITEKAWEHHHMGYDAGATFPHYLIPLLQMVKLWPDHPDAELWDRSIRSFAYGYFLPACFNNPFYLLPAGYFANEGLLTFSGLWHGINGAYGSAAALALEINEYTNDIRFKEIAIGNLQWIGGLNAGIEEKSTFVSKSMIYGIGTEFIGSWTKIPGTICNGFESDKQFAITKPKASADGPWVFTDEGWITHSGGWLSAISRL